MNKLKKFLVILASIATVFALFSTIQLKTVAATNGSIVMKDGTINTSKTQIAWESTELQVNQNKSDSTYYCKEDQISIANLFKGNTLEFIPKDSSILTSLTITIPEDKNTSYATALRNSDWNKGSVSGTSRNVIWNGYADASNPLVIKLTSSVYINSISYTVDTIENIAKAQDIKENLLYSYSYDENVKSIVNNPIEGRPYYLGNIVTSDDITSQYFAGSPTVGNKSISQTTPWGNYLVEKDSTGDYFYLSCGGKYIGYAGSESATNDLSINSSKIEKDSFLWYIDSNNLICNKATQNATEHKYLSFTSNSTYNALKAYTTVSSGKASATYPAAYLYTTKGDVSYSNVTMRIGYEISPDLKAIYDSLGYELGIVANGNYDIPCTAIYKEETNTYLYYAQITDIPSNNYNTPITARGYIKNTSYRYQTTEVNQYSVKTLAKEYITNHLDNEKVQAELYTLTYLAYCA